MAASAARHGRGPRVIAGSARGVQLLWPRPGTRPTTGRLREALFAMLQAADVDFEHVLDLYAGSGALGIEALSRGAETATFVEADARAAAVIRENLARVRMAERGRVVVDRVGRWRPAEGERYTLVLADPPYDDAGLWASVESSVRGALAEDATVAVEHDARRDPPLTLAGLPLWRDRRQGAGAVAVYRRRPGDADDGDAGDQDAGDQEFDDEGDDA